MKKVTLWFAPQWQIAIQARDEVFRESFLPADPEKTFAFFEATQCPTDIEKVGRDTWVELEKAIAREAIEILGDGDIPLCQRFEQIEYMTEAFYEISSFYEEDRLFWNASE